MPAIESHIDAESLDFRENLTQMNRLEADLREKLDAVRAGGGPEAVTRHRQQGKLLVRERIERLLDPGTPFLEIGALAAHGLYDGAAPSAGVVTGIARIRGREVMIVANDTTVKGGTYLPLTVKKHLRAQEIAEENRLPNLCRPHPGKVRGRGYYSTARPWDDGVIAPLGTRTVLGLGISAALNAPIPEPRFGVFRM